MARLWPRFLLVTLLMTAPGPVPHHVPDPPPNAPASTAAARSVAVDRLAARLGPTGRTGGRPPAPSPAPPARFSWPLDPPHPVLRRFDAPATPWGPGHRGVDLGGTAGEPVLAVADGVVVFAGYLVDRGVASVDHPGGLRSTYEPIAPVVVAGQAVRRGATIGHLVAGHPGCPGPACLHWGVRRGEEYLDPLTLVGDHRVRLLPPVGRLHVGLLHQLGP